MPQLRELPRLELIPSPSGSMYHWDAWEFPVEEWVPTIQAVKRAETSGELKRSLSFAAFAARAWLRQSRVHDSNRTQIWLTPGTHAHYQVTDGTPDLTYFRTGRGSSDVSSIDYLGPDAAGWRNNFATVHTPRLGHATVFNAEDHVTPVEEVIAHEAVRAVAKVLHDNYPGFELFQKLDAAGVDM